MTRFITQWPVTLCMGLYLYQASRQAVVGNWPMCGMWAGYALANVCLVFAQS